MKQFIILLLLPISCLCQNSIVSNVKSEFRNLSWIVDTKAAEVVSTLSAHYSIDSLMHNDTAFVTQANYNLYYDSLTLWYLTKDAYRDNDTTAPSTAIGFDEAKSVHTNAEWIAIYDRATRDAYTANGNSTVGENSCIPSTYSNLSLFYAKESKSIASYNSGRIKTYEYHSSNEFYKINFYLAFHKTIKPTNHNGAYTDCWMPYIYFYPKPKHKVRTASISKLWELKTGLPYSVAGELGLTDQRIPDILRLLGKTNDDDLIPQPKSDKEYEIFVSCDTCNVKLFDNQAEDKDVINFTYQDSTQQVHITNSGATYKIFLDTDNVFHIFAVSQGSMGTCTIDAIIDEHHHSFSLLKGQTALVRLIKK